MFGSKSNATKSISKINIIDVLSDGKPHNFHINKVCLHTENQKKAFKFHYDPEFNFYYLLSFVNSDGLKWFTDTTFRQTITKAIFEEIKYYHENIEERCEIKDVIIHLVKNGKYNKYFVSVIHKSDDYKDPGFFANGRHYSNIKLLFEEFKYYAENALKTTPIEKDKRETFINNFNDDEINNLYSQYKIYSKIANLLKTKKYNVDELKNHDPELFDDEIIKEMKDNIRKIKNIMKTRRFNKDILFNEMYEEKRFKDYKEVMNIEVNSYKGSYYRTVETLYNSIIEEINNQVKIYVNYIIDQSVI